MRYCVLGVKFNLKMMSVYWNNVLLKKLARLNKKKIKYKVKTQMGRFYFYFEKDPNSDKNDYIGRLLFFPNDVKRS